MDLFFEIALFLTPGIGNTNFKLLINSFTSAEEIFNQPTESLQRIRGIGQKVSANIIAKSTFAQAQEILKKSQDLKVDIVYYKDKKYPNRLQKHLDCPVLLFSKGNCNWNPEKSISIIGSRQVTDHGKKTVRKIISDLSPYQPQIISGLAYGVDIEAHRAALDKNLSTVAIMGSGIDVVYPKTHVKTANELQNNGALLTEQLFGTKPEGPNFPARNRIIAGMSDAVIVVEAATKGGALITARIANSYDVEVLACPGRILDNYNSGCNLLIENHEAHIYTSVQSIIKLLNWDIESKTPVKNKSKHLDLTDIQKKIVSVLTNSAKTKNQLVQLTEIPFTEIPQPLLELELLGIIETKTGGFYYLN